MASTSDTVTVTAPILTRVWIHDPDDPDNTVMHFLYHEARKESRTVQATATSYAGRVYPVYDFGDNATQDLDLPLRLAYADGDLEAKVKYLQDLLNSRKAFIYRDKRGRFIYGVTSAIEFTDTGIGTDVSLTIQAADFNEEI